MRARLLQLFSPRAEFAVLPSAPPAPTPPVVVEVPAPRLGSEVLLTRLVNAEGRPQVVDPPDGFQLVGWKVGDSSSGAAIFLLWTR